MNLYERYCLPHLIDFACGLSQVGQQREKIIPSAQGRVLEIGMGSGLNLPYYDKHKIEFIWGLEPSIGMRKKAQARLQQANIDVRWLALPGEQIPLQDHCVDTIVLTYTLCTIADWLTALTQMRRVLKPSGRLLFCEHGCAPQPSVQRWQVRLDPVWKIFSGGCHLARPIPELIQQGGFRLETLECGYLSGPRLLNFNYWGVAKQA